MENRGVQPGKEYAILTDELTQAWSGMTIRQYKNLKGLKKESLRDNMSTTELTLNQLAEVATRELSQQEMPQGFEQNRKVAQLNHVITQMIETSASAIKNQSQNDKQLVSDEALDQKE